MSKQLTPQQHSGSPAACMRRIVLGAMIVLAWSPTWTTIDASASSSASGNWLMQITVFRDLRNLLWSGPQSIAGPRPYIDVTAYGCEGDAATNDTACIQAAISAACAFTVGGQRVHPIVVFPPGYYFVAQPQKPSTAPVFEIPCSFLTFRGMGTSEPVQFDRPPSVMIQALPGASPNGAPIFDVRVPGAEEGITFQDLQIAGYNKALWIYATTGVKLDNVTLTVQNTSLADNSALMMTNNFWFEWNGGECANAEAINKFCILMTGDVPITTEAPLVGLTYIHNLQGIGGMVHYDQRVNTIGSGPGNMVFDNIRAWEANHGPFLLITNSTGNPGSAALPVVTNLTFNNVTASDSTCTPGVGTSCALIELNSSLTNLNGVIIDFSTAGTTLAIQNDNPTTSSVYGCNIRSGGNFSSVNLIHDANGNPISGCSAQSWNGFDYFVRAGQGNIGQDWRLRSDINSASFDGDALRATYNGSRFAGVSIDPVFGLMLNDGTDFGYGGGINQSVRGDVDVLFPAIYPPTSLNGTASTSGTTPAGTYYGTVYSCTSASSCLAGNQSAPSIQSAAVTVGGSNNAINWSWTLPTAGVSPVLGYCVAVSTVPDLSSGQWQPQQTNCQFITGASTTTLAMTTLPTTGGPGSVASTLLPAHRFTANSLGINATSPVAHTLTQNGGYVCPIVTKSSGYTLATGDCRIQVTGTTTITVPHTLPATGLTNIWHVFSVSGTTTLVCDGGKTINGASSITVANNTGKDAYTDGTNCFAQ